MLCLGPSKSASPVGVGELATIWPGSWWKQTLLERVDDGYKWRGGRDVDDQAVRRRPGDEVDIAVAEELDARERAHVLDVDELDGGRRAGSESKSPAVRR